MLFEVFRIICAFVAFETIGITSGRRTQPTIEQDSTVAVHLQDADSTPLALSFHVRYQLCREDCLKKVTKNKM